MVYWTAETDELVPSVTQLHTPISMQKILHLINCVEDGYVANLPCRYEEVLGNRLVDNPDSSDFMYSPIVQSL